ncbi:hypothetical protein Mapa_007270 [Marchantia paleacea]|nr:hypothetical protein Mapa_007270 [Marchantia paleacea]
MKDSTESAFLKALGGTAEEFVAEVIQHQSRPDKFVLKTVLTKISMQTASKICDALATTTSQELEAYTKFLEQEDAFKNDRASESAPSPSQRRRGSRKRAANSSSGNGNSLASGSEGTTGRSHLQDKRREKLKTLQGCATLANLSLAHASDVFQPNWLFPTVLALHDNLVILEADSSLRDSISCLCEHWWREKLDGNESLITQCMPFLLSKALSHGRKKDVQRVYSMRHALALFDFLDDSIEDLRHLLIRTVVTPAFLRSQPGRRFISYLFVLNPQLVKELVVIVRSQIPYGRKSILDAYGEILYHAWKAAEDVCLHEIEYTCIQGLIEGALHASSKALGASIRTVLEGFTSQKAQDGVESMLFRLLEPLLFRALQVANSNVRRNALLLLVEVFPVEDPDASKEEKEVVLEKQFGLLDKLLMDPSPDVRSVAVEVVCRILRLFWEVIPSGTTVKLLTKVVDEMAYDSSSNAVRLAVLKGVTYLLENAQSHAILKALLPRLGFLLNDNCMDVRVAAADLLLVIKGIRVIQFYKVVPVDSLLFSLSTDSSPVAQRLCKVLVPSYFPTKVTAKEACSRCVVLLKRSPQAATQFCKWLFSQGASGTSLLELVKTLGTMARDNEECSDEVRTEILHALSEVCKSMLATDEWREAIGEILTGDMLAALIACAPDSLGRSYVLQTASSLPPKNVSKLINYCGDLVMKCSVTPADVAEVRAVHALVLAWGGLDNLLEAFITILSEASGIASIMSPRVVRVHSTSTHLKRGNKRGKSALPGALDSSASKQDEMKRQTLKDKYIAAVGAAWQEEQKLKKTTKGCREQLKSRCSDSAELTELAVGFQLAWEELVGWLREMLSKTSKILTTLNSPSPQPIVKRARLPSRKLRQREPLSPLPVNTTSPGPEPKLRDHGEMLKIVANILQTTSDAYALGLITSPSLRRESASFVAESVQWLIDNCLKGKGRIVGGSPPRFCRDVWSSAKVIVTYAAKVLFLYVRDDTNEVEDGSMIAHSLLDFIAVLDSSKRLKAVAVPIVNSLQQWIPDLLIATTLLFTRSEGEAAALRVPSAGPRTPSSCSRSSEGLRQFRPWVAHLAVTAYESMAAIDDLETPLTDSDSAESRPTESSESPCADKLKPKTPSGHCVSSEEIGQPNHTDFLPILVKYLHRGHVDVMVAFIDVLIRFASLSFAKEDFSAAIGSLDLVCRRLLMCKLPEQKGLHFVLKSSSLVGLKQMMAQVGQALETTVSADKNYRNVVVIQKFLRTIITCYDDAEV